MACFARFSRLLIHTYNTPFITTPRMSSTLAKFAPGTGGVAQLRQNILVSTEPDNTPQQNMEMYDSWAEVFDQVSLIFSLFSDCKCL